MQVRVVTQALRVHDAAHGGGSCREAILGHARWAESLLTASCSDDVRPRLLSEVAQIKTLAGWAAHDLGLATEARQYLSQALRTTQDANDPAHSAIVLYYLGRVPLDNGDPAEAVKLFQLGQIAAQDAGVATPVAFLLANHAVAYAHLGDSRQAMTALRRAEDMTTDAISDRARETYAAAYATQAALRAGFDWYRAFPADAEANAGPGPAIDTPLLYLRGQGSIGRTTASGVDSYVEGLRRAGARRVNSALVPGALHFLAEEAPEPTWRSIERFLDDLPDAL